MCYYRKITVVAACLDNRNKKHGVYTYIYIYISLHSYLKTVKMRCGERGERQKKRRKKEVDGAAEGVGY